MMSETIKAALQDSQAVSSVGEVADIKDLITRLTDQFASSDARTAATLDAIQQQLATLSAQSRAARARVPSHLEVAFDRIDDAIAGLAQKLADAPEPKHPRADVEHAEAVFEAFANGDDEALPELRTTVEEPSPVDVTQAVEDSADEHGLSAVSKAGNPDEPWDAASAEALTRIYESDPVDLAPGLEVSEPVQAPVPVEVPSEPTEPEIIPEAGLAPVVGVDQPWLEERFVSIADQVAQTLTTTEAEVSFSEISRRLDDLESRFEQALQDVAVKPDSEALASIEGYINELSGQVEQSRQEFSRVGVIEQEIVALADRLSEDRIASFAAVAPQIEAPEIDFASIADLVAERLSVQQAMDETSATLVDDTSELRSLVGSLVESQRESGEQTNAMLDTVQKALIRVLDRIDTLETAQLSIAERLEQPPAEHLEQPAAVAPLAAQMPAMDHVAPAMEPPPSIRTATPQEPAEQVPQPLPGAAPLAAPPADAAPQPDETKRQNFIEAARRAAQAAASRPTLSAPLAASNTDMRVSPADALDHGEPEIEQADMPEEKAVAGGSAKSRLWFATFVLAVLAVGAGAYLVKGTTVGGENPVARQLITPETLERERAGKAGGENTPAVVREGTSNDKSDASSDGRSTSPTQIASAVSADNVPQGITVQEGGSPAAGAVPAALIPGAVTANAGALGSSNGAVDRGQAMMPPAKIGPASLRASAANGNASAQFEVGARFAEARGVDQDFKQAAVWYEKSAKQGFALAQYRIATLYERGLGVAKDHNLAKYWYMKSANQGTIKAMHNLAVLTAGQGSSSKPDYATAAAWFNRAAERGLADSQFNLAILYQNGLGVPKDLKESYKWFSLAARAGDAEAKTQEKALASQLSVADRTGVDQAVSQWRAKSYDLATNDPTKAGNLWQAASSAS